MPAIRTIPALVSAVVIAFPIAAWGQTQIPGDPPIKFRVAVKLANLMPEVQKFRVHCALRINGTPVAKGEAEQALPPSGSFDGSVVVPFNSLLSTYTIAMLAQANSYDCYFGLVGSGNTPFFPSPTAPPWAQPKTGAPFTPSVNGSFPPPQP